jgi:hypothetical protein
MNLTSTMAGNPSAFITAAKANIHARDMAIRACGSREDLYHEARSLGLSDQQIIANFLAEAAEAE